MAGRSWAQTFTLHRRLPSHISIRTGMWVKLLVQDTSATCSYDSLTPFLYRANIGNCWLWSLVSFGPQRGCHVEAAHRATQVPCSTSIDGHIWFPSYSLWLTAPRWSGKPCFFISHKILQLVSHHPFWYLRRLCSVGQQKAESNIARKWGECLIDHSQYQNLYQSSNSTILYSDTALQCSSWNLGKLCT